MPVVDVCVLTGGYLDLDRTTMLPDGEPATRWTVPVPCVLVVHARGRLLFDTGVHCHTITDAVGRLGPERAKRFGIRSAPGDDVVSQLARFGVSPGDVGVVANSHFHFDHCGGNEFFPHARFLIQRREADAARAALATPTARYRPSAQDFDHPLPYELIDGAHDVFGDGSVVLLPTYGHTPGHQSLVVRSGKDTRLVFTADACYTQANLDRDLLPLVVWDEAEMSRSLRALRTMRDADGATLFYGHDPAQWSALGLPATLN